jgi:hypothetical protein
MGAPCLARPRAAAQDGRGAGPDCDDGNPCNGNEICEVVTGTCLPALSVDGTACNDG